VFVLLCYEQNQDCHGKTGLKKKKERKKNNEEEEKKEENEEEAEEEEKKKKQIRLPFKETTSEVLHLDKDLYGVETWTPRKV
jgi:hypothetical protein